MKKLFYSLMLVVLLAVSGCNTVAVTGRKQLNLVSDSEVLSASLTQYNDYMKTAQKSTNKTQTAMVTRVGTKLATATEKYMRENGLEADLKNYSWEFTLVKSNEVNAFCMPGGKIVVYEGLMTMISNEDELAVVIGHEVAHAVAKHSNERMSQQVLASYGSQALSLALSQKSATTQSVANVVFGLGSQYGVMLPFSRKHEIEADYMGMVFMKIADYNPDAALTFWKKMSAGGSSTSEFLSTHPSDSRRIAEIEKSLPEIKKKY